MADVFISYKREERQRCVEIHDKLVALKLSVWFDARLESGRDFGDEIDREVRSAKAVLVLWSPAAAGSRWVRSEARIGQDRDVLCSAFVERTELPVMFVNTHTVFLTQRGFPDDDEAWLDVLRRIGSLVGRPGLAAYSKILARPDATSLRAWAQSWPDDPLAYPVSDAEPQAAGGQREQPRDVDPRPRRTPPVGLGMLAMLVLGAGLLWVVSSPPIGTNVPPPTLAPPAQPAELRYARVRDALDRLSASDWNTETAAALFKRLVSDVSVQEIAGLAGADDPRAQVLMGAAYQFGLEEVPRDEQQAMILYGFSANQGNVLGEFTFALMLETGPERFRNRQDAIRYYERATTAGHASAPYRLGLLYERGDPPLFYDKSEAVRLFRLAAERGNADAKRKLSP